MGKYTCSTCGASAEKASRLCEPATRGQAETFCGKSAGKVCGPRRKEMSYVCVACGSTAADPQFLCSPSKVAR